MPSFRFLVCAAAAAPICISLMSLISFDYTYIRSSYVDVSFSRRTDLSRTHKHTYTHLDKHILGLLFSNMFHGLPCLPEQPSRAHVL